MIRAGPPLQAKYTEKHAHVLPPSEVSAHLEELGRVLDAVRAYFVVSRGDGSAAYITRLISA